MGFDPSCQAARRDVNTLRGSGHQPFLDPIDYLGTFASSSLDARGRVNPKAHRRYGRDATPGEPVPTRSRTDSPPAPRMCPRRPARAERLWSGSSANRPCGPRSSTTNTWARATWSAGLRQARDRAEDAAPISKRSRGSTAASSSRRAGVRDRHRPRSTEKCHANRDWPGWTPTTPADRLARSSWRFAAWPRTLGDNVGRPNDWLEEYYFLLACYGASTGTSKTSSSASGSAPGLGRSRHRPAELASSRLKSVRLTSLIWSCRRAGKPDLRRKKASPWPFRPRPQRSTTSSRSRSLQGLSRNNWNSSSLLTPTGSNIKAQGRRRRTLGRDRQGPIAPQRGSSGVATGGNPVGVRESCREWEIRGRPPTQGALLDPGL